VPTRILGEELNRKLRSLHLHISTCMCIMWTMASRNVTLALDEGLLKRAQAKAKKMNRSLNALIRDQLIMITSDVSEDVIKEFIQVTDEVAGSSRGKKWSRSELYDR